MFKFTLACLATAAVGIQVNQKTIKFLRGAKYKALSAQEKFDMTMLDLKENMQAVDYDYEMGKFMTQRANVTTCNAADEIKKGRNKMGHQRGVVAPIQYVSEGGHPYTGFFESGATYGVIRLSDSGFIIDGLTSSNPSLAIKFFSDGLPSANSVAMIDWKDQNTLDFFPKTEDGEYKPFTTHPDPVPEDATCAVNSLVRKLRAASSTPFSSGVSSLALRDETGGIQGNRKDDFSGGYMWPYEVQYIPNGDAIPDYEGGDPLEYLSGIEANGEHFFEVWAREDPDTELELIGKIFLSEGLFQSEFGDQSLFFQHDPFNRDCSRLSKAGHKKKAAAWRSMEKYNQGDLPDKWDEKNDVVPDMPEGMDPMDVVEQGIQGTLEGATASGCPFAWMFIGA